MRKVSVVGVSASGKSTLTTTLTQLTGLPAIELDALHWKSNWQICPSEEFQAKVEAQIQAEQWIVDGNYSKVRSLVWEKADTIIWIKIPLRLNLWNAIRRSAHRIFTREKLWGTDNRESLWRQFSKDSIIRWVWQTYWRHNEGYAQAFRRLSRLQNSPRLVCLQGTEQIRSFLDSVRCHTHHDFVEKVLLYPVRFTKGQEPEILVQRNAVTGLVEVISDTRHRIESISHCAEREAKRLGLSLIDEPQRFSVASTFVKVPLKPLDESGETPSRAVQALRAIGKNGRQRTQYELHHAYFVGVTEAQSLGLLRRKIIPSMKKPENPLFWMSLTKAQKTMGIEAKTFLNDLTEYIQNQIVIHAQPIQRAQSSSPSQFERQAPSDRQAPHENLDQSPTQ